MGIRLVKHGVAADGGTYDHNKLENRDLPDQHPISSITGLQEELNKIGLDVEDTTSIDLELNKDTKTLTANINLSKNEDNGLEIKEDGLYCNGSGGGNSILKINQNKHGLNVGDVVYLKSDGMYAKAFAEDSERIEVIGVITKITDENNFIITVAGEFKTTMYESYASGATLYLSDNPSYIGTLISAPTSYIKPIATKIHGGILINIRRGNVIDLIDDTTVLVYYTQDEIKNAIDSIW